MDNIFDLRRLLAGGSYVHGKYHAFNINDPKPRQIHKAAVQDRLVHHAVYRVVYPYFDRRFIRDSFSCRVNKGTHKALERFRRFEYTVSENYKRTVWVLKCDVKRFFASVDQRVLMSILERDISDKKIVQLLEKIITSFDSGQTGIGLPLGNLTSQLLVNIYMNEFDQFAKRELRARCYIRYADDFVVLSQDREELVSILARMKEFLWSKLRLKLHGNKIHIRSLVSGVDYLGWIIFPDHVVIRTKTRRKMMRRLRERQGNKETIQSYLGLLSHGNTFKLREEIRNRSINLQ